MRYEGTPNFWKRLVPPDPDKPVPHLHACPECYEDYPCELDCTLEPDLEREDGTPAGGYFKCDRCDPRDPEPAPVEIWINPDQLSLF